MAPAPLGRRSGGTGILLVCAGGVLALLQLLASSRCFLAQPGGAQGAAAEAAVGGRGQQRLGQRGADLGKAAAALQRRRLLLGALFAGAPAASSPAWAYQKEENRQAQYVDKAKAINYAADWYLFDVRPLIYISDEMKQQLSCKETFNLTCDNDLYGLSRLFELYRSPPQQRSAPVNSKPMSYMISPMKILSTAAVFDPDTSDELRDIVQDLEVNQYRLTRAAKMSNETGAKAEYVYGRELLNKYFGLCNKQSGLAPDNDFYLTPLPEDPEKTSNQEFWDKRKRKYVIKKRVDQASKGDKTARFYAKSIFGEDAVSWDSRGDRAIEFATPMEPVR